MYYQNYCDTINQIKRYKKINQIKQIKCRARNNCYEKQTIKNIIEKINQKKNIIDKKNEYSVGKLIFIKNI